ncbi:hypothetical protein POSPLADRAFT_1030219 [Postia placenta MAD-698-R-SB12]|uniref:F-box domain-containing protein n=1 Tax=Postia placenta MAD-698-R-SB12 TaxID=670580 RepID=A0A1X6NF06_9APHY|nr:hypothetical protein POSPLADRAFT_1030219 [Postia placenta MAD-698-R-SB12]OSX67026.1 hypothetical protein POSPLADRAFT_1030219 [Postia placenta MAD-698-R-SB12]
MCILQRRSIVPLEIAEHIITDVGPGHQNYKTLLACSLTCKAWVPRSRFVLYTIVTITTESQLYSFSESIKRERHLSCFVKELVIVWNQEWNETTLSSLLVFPAMFARRLPNLEKIKILSDLALTPPSIRHPCFYLSIGEFRSVVSLVLSTITFCSFREFARPLLALPTLSSLECLRVHWKNQDIDTFSSFESTSLNLVSLAVEGMEPIGLASLLSGTNNALQHLSLDYAPEYGEGVWCDSPRSSPTLPELPHLKDLTLSLRLRFANTPWLDTLLCETKPYQLQSLTIEFCDPHIKYVDFKSPPTTRVDELLGSSYYESLTLVRVIFRTGRLGVSHGTLCDEVKKRLPKL